MDDDILEKLCGIYNMLLNDNESVSEAVKQLESIIDTETNNRLEDSKS